MWIQCGDLKVQMNAPITVECLLSSPRNSILMKLYRRVIMCKLSYEATEACGTLQQTSFPLTAVCNEIVNTITDPPAPIT
jgi:hypothetical protein